VASFVLTESDTVIHAFILYCVIGLAVGGLLAAAYWLWARRPDMPQGFFRHPPSRATAGVIAAAGALAFIIIGARAELMSFSRIDVDSTQVRLHFAFPERSLALQRGEIESATLGLGGEKGQTVRLVLYTRRGERHESTPTPRARFEAARAALGVNDAQ
jgi:hypothetical protein